MTSPFYTTSAPWEDCQPSPDVYRAPEKETSPPERCQQRLRWQFEQNLAIGQKIRQEEEGLDRQGELPTLFIAKLRPTRFKYFWSLPYELRLCVLEQLDPTENPKEWLNLCNMEEFKPMADALLCKVIQERVAVFYCIETYGSVRQLAPYNSFVSLPGKIRFDTLPDIVDERKRTMIFTLAHRAITPQWKYERDQRLIRKLYRPACEKFRPPPSSWNGAVVSVGDDSTLSSDQISSRRIPHPEGLRLSSYRHESYYKDRLWATSHMGLHTDVLLSAEEVARRVLTWAVQSLEATNKNGVSGKVDKWCLRVNVDAGRCYGGHMIGQYATETEVARILEEENAISDLSNSKGEDFLEVITLSINGLPARCRWVGYNPIRVVSSIQTYVDDESVGCKGFNKGDDLPYLFSERQYFDGRREDFEKTIGTTSASCALFWNRYERLLRVQAEISRKIRMFDKQHNLIDRPA